MTSWKGNSFHINSLAPGKFELNFRYVILKWILVIDGSGISCEIALIWMSLNFTDDQSTLVQVMAWCRQATSHYLSQWWSRSLSPYGITRPQWVNGLVCAKCTSQWWFLYKGPIMQTSFVLFFTVNLSKPFNQKSCFRYLRHLNMIYIIKWKHLLHYWPFVWGIHRSPVNSSHKGQWRGALMFSLICAWINHWLNNREASDLRCHHAHYDIIVMKLVWSHCNYLLMT